MSNPKVHLSEAPTLLLRSSMNEARTFESGQWALPMVYSLVIHVFFVKFSNNSQVNNNFDIQFYINDVFAKQE